MFHSAHLGVRRGTQPSAFRSFFGSVDTGHDNQPLRRGLLFTTVSGVLLLVGGILTWLGFHNVLANYRVSTTGPLLMALSLLLFLVSIRQFLAARKKNMQNRSRHAVEQLASGTIAAVVIDSEEVDGTVTVIMDTFTPATPEVVRGYGDIAPPSYTEATEPSGVDDNTINISDYVHECIHADPPPSYTEATQGSQEQDDGPLREEIIPAPDNCITVIK